MAAIFSQIKLLSDTATRPFTKPGLFSISNQKLTSGKGNHIITTLSYLGYRHFPLVQSTQDAFKSGSFESEPHSLQA